MNVWKVFDKAMEEAVLTLKGKHDGEEPVDDKVVKDLKERATVWFKKELIEWDKNLEVEV